MLPCDRAFLSGLSGRGRWRKQDAMMAWAQGISNLFPALSFASQVTPLYSMEWRAEQREVRVPSPSMKHCETHRWQAVCKGKGLFATVSEPHLNSALKSPLCILNSSKFYLQWFQADLRSYRAKVVPCDRENHSGHRTGWCQCPRNQVRPSPSPSSHKWKSTSQAVPGKALCFLSFCMGRMKASGLEKPLQNACCLKQL